MIESTKLGPGTFKLGPTGTPVDASCQLQGLTVTVSKDEGDTLRVLCGDTVPGSITYTYALDGSILQDLAKASGIVQYTWEHAGEQVPFAFVPNSAAVVTVAGTVVIDPLSIGGDEYGANMTSDFTWTITGVPTIKGTDGTDWVIPGQVTKGNARPGDVFAAEATVTASDSTNAAKLTPLGYVANPTTAWTAGQFMSVGSYNFNWSGSAWAAGAHA